MSSTAVINPRSFELYGLLAETFIHAGIGQAHAAIDLPIARESATGYPYIAGSSSKGASRDAFRRHWWTDRTVDGQVVPSESEAERRLFGPETGGAESGSAGELIFSDVRLLLLPVRSLTGACRYVTCPELIYRFLADCRRAGHNDPTIDKLVPTDTKTAITKGDDGPLYLEELCFTAQADNGVSEFANCVKRLRPQGSGFENALEQRLTILHDDAFAWFAENALPVRMRNALKDDGSKKVQNQALWSEEYLAPDTLMYTLVGTRRDASAVVHLPLNGGQNGSTKLQVGSAFMELINAERGYLQLGGNETVGHGWFRVSLSRLETNANPGGAS